jgi:hypothetical protein
MTFGLTFKGNLHGFLAVSAEIYCRVYGGGTVAVSIGEFKEAGSDKDGKSFERSSIFTNVWVLYGKLNHGTKNIMSSETLLYRS